MARLLRPVAKIISVMPAAAASSTAYWMSGLSTTGIISLGLALVTGRKRLPTPATGNTAFLSLVISAPQDFAQLRLIDHQHAEALRLHELVDRLHQLRADAFEGHLAHGLAALAALAILLPHRLLVCHQRRPIGLEECLQRAEVAGEELRHLLAHTRHAECVNKAVQLG